MQYFFRNVYTVKYTSVLSARRVHLVFESIIFNIAENSTTITEINIVLNFFCLFPALIFSHVIYKDVGNGVAN